MADATFREIVTSGNGTVTVACNHNKQNIQWIVWQMSVESSDPNTEGEIRAVRRNGRLLTSSFIIPASAQGPPAIILDGNDNLTVDFVGMSSGEEAIVTLYFQEIQVGQLPPTYGVV